MRKVFKTLLAIMLVGQQVAACPNCVGRITPESKPFFSDEFYKVEGKSLHHLYQALENKTTNESSFATAASTTDSSDEAIQSGEQQ